ISDHLFASEEKESLGIALDAASRSGKRILQQQNITSKKLNPQQLRDRREAGWQAGISGNGVSWMDFYEPDLPNEEFNIKHNNHSKHTYSIIVAIVSVKFLPVIPIISVL
ncbi:hypothetical protein ACJX0J_025036, partial [Zea mays]